jgi:DNA (cytosine-5)-methyltransferase 1
MPKDDATLSAASVGSKPLTFGSLFAGIGGFDLGLERAGMRCEWQVEIDPYARAVLAKHWPDVRRHEDVRTFPPPEGEWGVDVICGGFPCQDISVAGKGAGLAGARSGLWYEYARIIGELRPRYVIVENVAALLSRGMGTVLGDLSSLGYDAEWHVIPASAVGAPHRRDRVWIVADTNGRRLHRMRADSGDGGTLSEKGQQWIVCGGRGSQDVADSENERDGRKDDNGKRQGASQKNGLPLKPRRGGRHGGLLKSGDAWWSVEPDVGRVAHGVPSRVDRLRCLGNAVVPQIVEVIGRAIVKAA